MTRHLNGCSTPAQRSCAANSGLKDLAHMTTALDNVELQLKIAAKIETRLKFPQA